MRQINIQILEVHCHKNDGLLTFGIFKVLVWRFVVQEPTRSEVACRETALISKQSRVDTRARGSLPFVKRGGGDKNTPVATAFFQIVFKVPSPSEKFIQFGCTMFQPFHGKTIYRVVDHISQMTKMHYYVLVSIN